MIMPNVRTNRDKRRDATPRFKPGQLVRHRRYGYRGVVADLDATCKADDTWYQKNKTQPDRAQPWYHVLVHGTSSATYAAQENLLPDDSSEPVQHPMIDFFFNDFFDGRYVRNDTPWVGW